MIRNSSRNNSKGWTLIGLLIIILSVSVVSMALWNAFSQPGQPWGLISPAASVNKNLQSTLDNIAFHIKECLSDDSNPDDKFDILQGINSDTLMLKEGEYTLRFFVDNEQNLIRQYDKSAIVLASAIESLRVRKINSDNIMVSLTPASSRLFESGPQNFNSKIFSAVVNIDGQGSNYQAGF